jgi:hypothetical protein
MLFIEINIFVQSVGRKYVLDFNDGGTTQVAGDGQDT